MRAELHDQAEGVAPRVLREVLRTPAFRELVSLHASGVEPAEVRSAVRVLVEDAVELPLGLAAVTPAAVDAAVAAALELGRQGAAMPAPLRDAFVESVVRAIDSDALRQLPSVWGPLLLPALPLLVNAAAHGVDELASSLAQLALDPERAAERAAVVARLAAGVDGAQLGRALTAVATLINRVPHALAATAPQARREELRRPIADLVRATDPGALRCAAAALSAAGREAARAFVDETMADPVAAANLAVALPPLVNDQLAIAQHLLSQIDLPDELLASGLFSVLGDLDVAALGRLLGAVARLTNAVHRGSLVLGGTEPELRRVLDERVEAMLEGLDGDELALALKALGEDGEVVAQVLAGVVRRDPSLPGRAVAAALGGGAPLLRGLVDLLRELNQLPSDAVSAVAEQLVAGANGGELAALARELAALARRLDDAQAVAPLARALVAVLDQDVVDDAAWRALRAFAAALSASPRARGRLEPEAVGRWITELLRRFNRACEATAGAGPGYLPRVAAAIDAVELERAWAHALRPLVAAVARPVLLAGWRTACRAARGRP
jgi:hypothetical protein